MAARVCGDYGLRLIAARKKKERHERIKARGSVGGMKVGIFVQEAGTYVQYTTDTD